MKKVLLSILGLFAIIGLSSCSTGATTPSATTTTPTATTITPNSSSIPQASTSTSNTSKSVPTSLRTTTINPSTIYVDSYQTNYEDHLDANGLTLGGYRAGYNLSEIYPYHFNFKDTNYEGKEGAIFNSKSIENIYTITLSYRTSDSYCRVNAKAPNVTFGDNIKCKDYKYDLKVSSTNITETVDVSDYEFKYFSINTGDYLTKVDSITVKYTTAKTRNPIFTAESGKDKIRFNPIRYDSYLTPGVSKITIPTGYEYISDGNKYVATTTKELTYYTADYVANHMECYDDATITNPMEVCMYYSTFGTWPANYSMNTGSISRIFGSDARKVSRYSRTDGYATSIPWNGNGVYYELDIDFDGSYSLSSRGTGRVVAFERGWSDNNRYDLHATGYDNSPVCVYTDDHYNTWLEYYNNGTWSNRFNGEGVITGVSYSAPTTVEISDFDSHMVEGTPQTPSGDDPVYTPSTSTVKKEIPDNLPEVDPSFDDTLYYGNFAPATVTNPDTAKYQRVTTIDGIVEGGTYLLVNLANEDNPIYDSLLWGFVEIDEYEITFLEPTDFFADMMHLQTFSIEKYEDGYSFYDNNAYYLSYESTDTYLQKDDNPQAFKIMFINGDIIIYTEGVWLQLLDEGGYKFSSELGHQFRLYRYCDQKSE